MFQLDKNVHVVLYPKRKVRQTNYNITSVSHISLEWFSYLSSFLVELVSVEGGLEINPQNETRAGSESNSSQTSGR